MFAHIEPLYAIGAEVKSVTNQIADEKRVSIRKQLEERRYGMIQCAMWIMMSEREKCTKQPQELIPSDVVETYLADLVLIAQNSDPGIARPTCLRPNSTSTR